MGVRNGTGGDGRMGMDGWMDGLWGSDGMIASGGKGGDGWRSKGRFSVQPRPGGSR